MTHHIDQLRVSSIRIISLTSNFVSSDSSNKGDCQFHLNYGYYFNFWPKPFQSEQLPTKREFNWEGFKYFFQQRKRLNKFLAVKPTKINPYFVILTILNENGILNFNWRQLKKFNFSFSISIFTFFVFCNKLFVILSLMSNDDFSMIIKVRGCRLVPVRVLQVSPFVIFVLRVGPSSSAHPPLITNSIFVGEEDHWNQLNEF